MFGFLQEVCEERCIVSKQKKVLLYSVFAIDTVDRYTSNE